MTQLEKLDLYAYADELDKNANSKSNTRNPTDQNVADPAVGSDDLTEEVIRSLENRILDKSSSAYDAW